MVCMPAITVEKRADSNNILSYSVIKIDREKAGNAAVAAVASDISKGASSP